MLKIGIPKMQRRFSMLKIGIPKMEKISFLKSVYQRGNYVFYRVLF